jgi:hypothetical protein
VHRRSLEMTCSTVWMRCSYSMDEMFIGIALSAWMKFYVDKIVGMCSIELDEM